jgi:hypothetical protein
VAANATERLKVEAAHVECGRTSGITRSLFIRGRHCIHDEHATAPSASLYRSLGLPLARQSTHSQLMTYATGDPSATWKAGSGRESRDCADYCSLAAARGYSRDERVNRRAICRCVCRLTSF